jgi:hypothetical protein
LVARVVHDGAWEAAITSALRCGSSFDSAD